MIESREQAETAIKDVAEWLEREAKREKKAKPRYKEPKVTAGAARDFACDLLEAAKADGLGGCPLCAR